MLNISLQKLIEQDTEFQKFMAKIINAYPSTDNTYPADIIYALYSTGNSVQQVVQFFKLMETFHEDCCNDDHHCDQCLENEE